MTRTYTITTGSITISAATTLIAFQPPTSTQIKVVRATLSQRGTATSEQVRVQIGRKASAFPTSLTSVNTSGATQPLLTKHCENDGASSLTGATSLSAGKVGTASTSEGAGTFQVLLDESFNNLTGFVWVPGPDEELKFAAGSSDAFVMRVPTAPTNTSNWQASITIQED